MTWDDVDFLQESTMDQACDYCPVCDHVVSLFEACLKCEKAQCGGCNAVCCLAETASTSDSSTPRASEKRQALPKREPKERPTGPVSLRTFSNSAKPSLRWLRGASGVTSISTCNLTGERIQRHVSESCSPRSGIWSELPPPFLMAPCLNWEIYHKSNPLNQLTSGQQPSRQSLNSRSWELQHLLVARWSFRSVPLYCNHSRPVLSIPRLKLLRVDYISFW